MKAEVKFRITITDPLEDVAMMVQKGKDELLAPTLSTKAAFVFEFPITVDLASGEPNFLGKFEQGPKDSRFVYVNSGTYAAQPESCWGRRAKLSLMAVTGEQVNEAIAKNVCIETTMRGVGSDGGPTCAECKRPGVEAW